jgi:hypothetical protein
MNEKTLVQNIYIKVLKFTYNKLLNLIIDKLLHPFLFILHTYICFYI